MRFKLYDLLSGFFLLSKVKRSKKIRPLFVLRGTFARGKAAELPQRLIDQNKARWGRRGGSLSPNISNNLLFLEHDIEDHLVGFPHAGGAKAAQIGDAGLDIVIDDAFSAGNGFAVHSEHGGL